MIRTLDHIGITVKDLDKSLFFYSKLLGFPVLKRKMNAELKVAYALVQVGQSAIEILSPIEEEPSSQKTVEDGMEGVGMKIRRQTGLNHISLTVDDIEGIHKELKSRGIQFIVEPESTGSGSKIAFFTDPDGNLLELIQRP